MADQEQPDWLSLPSDLLELIGQRSRDAVTGLAAFRSVCRAWRAAVEPAPRLVLPRTGSDSEFVFPLSRGWSVVVHVRDASCHLSHLATGATAALPNLNAVRDSRGGIVTHRRFETCDDVGTVTCGWFRTSYFEFADMLRFVVHVEPGAPAAAGMTIMMGHQMLEPSGMLFCRPGDAAWTKVESPSRRGFGFAYHDGNMFIFNLDSFGAMVVYNAATLDVFQVVHAPPATPNLAHLEDWNFAHLVSLPSKLILVRISVKSYKPVAFDIFELGFTPDGLASWLKVKDAGNYELFIDGHHTTFRENRANRGSRIYYVYDEHWSRFSSINAAYCYDMQDNKLECVYRLPEGIFEGSTKPCWFVP